MIWAELSVFKDMKHTMGAVEAAKQFDSLVKKMDASTVTTGIEKIRTAGTGYVAAAGLSAPQIDHAQRAIAFAEESCLTGRNRRGAESA